MFGKNYHSEKLVLTKRRGRNFGIKLMEFDKSTFS
jgi:hypothetical protein